MTGCASIDTLFVVPAGLTGPKLRELLERWARHWPRAKEARTLVVRGAHSLSNDDVAALTQVMPELQTLNLSECS